MTKIDDLRFALHEDQAAIARQLRADRTKAAAFSPMRIGLRLLMVPIVTLGVTMSLYSFGSPFPREDAIRHLVAMTGCDNAYSVGLSHMVAGEVGYHAKLNPDGNGIACENGPENHIAAIPVTPTESGDTAGSTISGAKFLRP